MGQYAVRRILWAVPSILGIVTLIFVTLRILPGDIAQLALEGTTDQTALTAARHQLGIDQPLWSQYLAWLGDLAHGQLGTSFKFHSDLNAEIARAFPVTAHVVLLAVAISLLIALPAGITSAVRRGSAIDYVARVLSISGLSIPGFWLGILILVVLSRGFNWVPPLRWVPIWESPLTNLQIIIWPALAVGYIEAGVLTRMVRSSMLEVLGHDYVRTARSKGLREDIVVVRHALFNSLIPVVTVLGSQLASLLGGLVVIETVFNLPGMGYLLVQAIALRDFPMVQAVSLVVAVTFVTINLAVDLAYGILDPRIRYS